MGHLSACSVAALSELSTGCKVSERMSLIEGSWAAGGGLAGPVVGMVVVEGWSNLPRCVRGSVFWIVELAMNDLRSCWGSIVGESDNIPFPIELPYLMVGGVCYLIIASLFPDRVF